MAIHPEGKFRAKSLGGEIGEAETGTVQIRIEFTLLDGPHVGVSIDWYGFFTEKAIERTLESMRYAGWLGNDPDNLSSLGRKDVPEVQLVIEHEQVKEKGGAVKTDAAGQPVMRARVRWVNPARAAMKALDPSKKTAFAQNLRAALASVDQNLKTSGQVAPPAAGDIPF